MELVAKFISEEANIITLEIYKNPPTAFQAWKKTTTSWISWSSSSPRTRTLTSRPRWPWTEASTLAKDRHQEPGRRDQLTKVELKTQFSRWFKDIYFDEHFALGKFQSCDFGTAPIGPLTTCPLTTQLRHLALLYWGINGFLTMTKESPVLAHFLGRGTSILSGLGLDDEWLGKVRFGLIEKVLFRKNQAQPYQINDNRVGGLSLVGARGGSWSPRKGTENMAPDCLGYVNWWPRGLKIKFPWAHIPSRFVAFIWAYL